MSVSNTFKQLTKKIKQQDSKILLKDNMSEIAKQEITFRFEGKLFNTIMKEIVLKTKQKNLTRGQNLNFKYGLFVEDDFEYIDLGDFYINDEPEINAGEEAIEVTAYDKMIYFMKEFKQAELNLNYPCTMLELVNKMCNVCGVELYSTNFFNSGLVVNEDYFTNQKITYRNVLEKIAEATLSTIYIKDNKLYLAPISMQSIETLDRSYLTKLVVTDKFGPVNALVLGRGDVEDNVESKDDESIAENGRCEIRFDENEFIEYQREEVINSMFEQIKGLKYYAFEGADLGIMWIEPATCLTLKDNEVSLYNSYYLNANVKINTGITSSIGAEIPECTNTEYKVSSDEESKILKVERLAKKNEGLIKDLVQETTETTEKVNEIQSTVDGTVQRVSETETRLNNDYLSKEQVEAENQTLKDDIDIIKQQQTTITTTAQGLQVQIDKINNDGVKSVKNTTVDINEAGVSVGKSDSEFSTTMNNTGTYMYAYGKQIAKYDKDGMETADLKATGEVEMGYLKLMKTTVNSEKRTHIHWIGG